MKKFFFALSALFLITMSNAQTADEIIAKHIDALGGKDKLSQINSVYIESNTEVMGNESATKTYIINGKDYRNESDFGGQSLVQVVTENGGWQINPFQGSPDPAPMSDDEAKGRAEELYFNGDPLINYADNGGKVELAGQEKVGDVNAYKLKYTNKYNLESYIYIDPATWYIIETTRQANMMGQDITMTTSFSNYKQTDFGVFMPYTTHIDMGQFALDINIQKAEINKEIDPSVFEMPKK